MNRVRYTRHADVWPLEDDLPEGSGNPEFEEIFTEAQQNEIAARFDRGIDLGQRNEILQLRATTEASQACAKRFRDAAARRNANQQKGVAKRRSGRS